MRDQKRLMPTLVLGLLLAFALVISVFFRYNVHALGPSAPRMRLLSESMNESQNGQARVFTVTLPSAFDREQSLLFKTTHTAVVVALDRESLHVHSQAENPSFLKSPGALWHIVDLPEGSAGKTLSVFISSVYPGYYGNDPVIRYGSHEGCSLALLIDALPIVVIDSIILFVGIFCLGLHTMGWLRKNRQARNAFLFLGMFAISIAAWSLCQSGFLQFILPSGPALYLTDFISFYLFPACFNLFCASICKGRSESYFCIFTSAYLLENLLSVTLQLLGLMDMFQLLRMGHLTMAINVPCVFYFLHEEVKQERNAMARKIRFPIYILMLFAACELVVYYLRDFRETSFFIPLGTFVFIILLASALIGHYYHGRIEEEKMAYYKKLANMDLLTGVYNRSAYIEHEKLIDERTQELQRVSAVRVDVSELKHINERYGHESGDIALRTCCRCMKQAFGEQGNCYRLGDGEFVYLTGYGEELRKAVIRFEDLVKEEDKGFRFPFAVSVGYGSFDPERDHNLHDLIARCDEMLYYNKRFRRG